MHVCSTKFAGIALACLAVSSGWAGPGAGGTLAAAQQKKAGTTVSSAPFGKLPDGTPVEQYTLSNASGTTVKVITYGAIVTSIRTADRTGHGDDIVLGFETLDGYLKNTPYFGVIVGRYGNRIAKASFTLDGRTYTLFANDGANSIHGGKVGFDKKVWSAKAVENGVALSLTSPDGDEGYPGTLKVTVTYTLTNANALVVDYQMTTDKATPHNLTQHSYFNLTGGTRDVLAHEIMLRASRFTPVDATIIPTGVLAPVAGTPFDLTSPKAIGASIDASHEQLARGRGYDHNFVIDRTGDGLAQAASVYDPQSGRTLDVATTEPGVQFYTGNFLDGTITGKGGVVYKPRWGFCLETQHFPDSPNQPAFPSAILRPGQTYTSRTVFTFGVRK